MGMRIIGVLAATTVALLAPSCSDSGDFVLGVEANIAIDPTSVAFGDVPRGGVAFRIVTIRHIGTSGVIQLNPIALETDSPDLSVGTIERTSLEPGQESRIQIVYNSDNDPPDKGELVIGHNIVNNRETRIPIQTPGQRAELIAKPGSLDFGAVQAGAPATLTVQVYNLGSAPADLQGWTVLDDEESGESEFSVTLPANSIVTPNSSTSVQVSYSPVGRDSDKATVRITTEREDVSLEIDVQGEEQTPILVAEPGTVQFSWVEPGGQIELRELRLRNMGNAPLSVSEINLIDAHPSITVTASAENETLFNDLPVTMDPGDVIKIAAFFEPIEEIAMTADPLAKLEIRSTDAAHDPLLVPMFGAAGNPGLAFVPSEVLDFGYVAEDFTSRREVTVLNIGNSALSVNAAQLSGATSDEFTLGANTLPVELNPGDTTTIEVTFENRGGVKGTEFATLFVTSSDPLIPEYALDVVARRSERPTCEPAFVPELLALPAVREGDEVKGTIKVLNFGSGNCEYRAHNTRTCLTLEKHHGLRLEFDCDRPGLKQLFEVTGSPAQGQTLGPGDQLSFEVTYTGQRVSDEELGRESQYGRLVIEMFDPNQQSLAWVAPEGGYGGGVNLRGTSAIPMLRVEPEAIDYSFVRTECESYPRVVTVSNVGPVDANIETIQRFECSEDMYLSPEPNIPTTVPGWGKYYLESYFAPSTGGGQNCTLRVNTDGYVQNNLNRPYGDVALGGFAIAATHQVDTFSQVPPPKVDVLFVVDDSGSMADEQNLLRQELPKLVDIAVSWGQDYHLAVTTTDTIGVEGQFQGTPRFTSQQDSTEQFALNLVVGITGYWEEMGLEAAWMALGGVMTSSTAQPCVNAPGQCPQFKPGKSLWCIDGFCRGPNWGFLRPDAELVIIIVSDEEDSSPQSVGWYVSNFSALKGAGSGVGVKIHTIVTPLEGCFSGFGSVGLRYIQATDAFGGHSASICATDFTEEFATISNQTFGLADRFYPSLPPDPDTLVVRVNGMECASGWFWNDVTQAVVFDENGGCMPDYGESIELEYDVVCNGNPTND